MAESLKECSVSCKSSWRRLAELCRSRRLRCPALGVSRRRLRHCRVEQLRDYRRVRAEDFYLVKWEGCPESANTWEPKQNLRCPALLQQLHRDLAHAPGGPFRPSPRGLPPRALSYLRQKAEQRRALRRWQQLLNSRAGQGGGGGGGGGGGRQQSLTIEVENEVDLQGPPADFIYIQDYKLGPGVEVTPVAVGCECQDCWREGRAGWCCPGASRHKFAYTARGRLRLRAGLPIVECNSRCGCGGDCPNRVVQRGAPGGLRLCIFRTADGRGWGVRTLRSIRPNCFVMEYVGEIITTEEAERRGQEYDRQGATYLFDLDYVEDVYTVDAARYGNISHFVNHSCEPNLQVFNVFIENLDPRLPRIALFSARHIRAGEELTFDYRPHVDPVDAESSRMDSNFGLASGGAPPGGSPRARGRIECKCGAGTCRKFLF